MYFRTARPLPRSHATLRRLVARLGIACGCLLPSAAASRADDSAPARLEELEEAYVPTPDAARIPQSFELSDPDIILAQKVQDPAIETVDEMTARRGSSGGSKSGGGSAGQWWDSIRDPAIRTVD